MTTAILGLLAWLNAIRIAAVGEANANRWSAVDGTISAILVVGAFTIASLSTPSFMIDVLILCAPVAIIYATWFAVACSFASFSDLSWSGVGALAPPASSAVPGGAAFPGS